MMNERIKELIKAVGGIGHDDDGNELTPALVGKELEKFAELIVLECAELVETQHTWITSVAASALIRKHFGVEE